MSVLNTHDYKVIELDSKLGVPDKRCYQCDKLVRWLAPDSRCNQCTRLTPEEVCHST